MEVILVVAREGSTCDFKINAGETDEIRIRLLLLLVNNTVKVKVTQSCPTLCDPYTVHGILQTRISGVGSLSLLQGSSQPRDQTQVSHIADGFLTS